MKNKEFSIEAIENGTAINHIPTGLGLTIPRQFKLLHYGSAVTADFNLSSKTRGSKDIIKISGVAFDGTAANRLALFVPEVIVSTIADFEVVDERHPTLPDEITEVFRYPSASCASHGESVKDHFYVRTQDGQTRLRCHYCEKIYNRGSVAEA